MRGKVIIAVFGMIFLLMSITYAGILNYYGKIEGMAEVGGPVFYAAPEKTLLINEEPGSFPCYDIKDGESLIFWTTEDLGGIDFDYIPKADLYVRAKVNNPSPPKPLKLTFGYSDISGIMHEICFSTVNINSTELGNYHTTCSGSSTLSNVTGFYYKIEGAGSQSIEYEICTKNTRIEVSKA